MEINKKKKLKDLLLSISTEDEKKEIARLDSLKIKEITDTFDEAEMEHEEKYDKLEKMLVTVVDSFNSYRKAAGKHSESLTTMFGDVSTNLTKGLEKLSGTLTTSYEKNKPFNAAGVYKDMINQLSQVNQNIIEKPVPVWNWPQYASVGVRNKNFSNINPSIDGFDIGDYDDVTLAYTGNNLTTVTYFLNGSQTAVLALSYDGSNNLIEAQRIS